MKGFAVVSASLRHAGSAEGTRTEAVMGRKERDSLLVLPVYMLLRKAAPQWLRTGKGLFPGCFS